MNKLFVSYELAKLAKEKGFNEPCLAYYAENKILQMDTRPFEDWCRLQAISHPEVTNTKIQFALNKDCYAASLYQQLIDWFREKHRYHIDVTFQESIGNKVEFINTPYYSIEIYHLHGGDAWKTYKFVAFSDDYYITLNKALEEAFKLIKK